MHNFCTCAKIFWNRGFSKLSKEVQLWFHFLVRLIISCKQYLEFPRADKLPFLTTTIHSQLMRHMFFKVMHWLNKEINSSCRIECVSIFCHFKTERTCGHLDVVSCRGTDGDLLLVEGSSRTSDLWSCFLQVTGRI